jgi:tRNA modification GTPase
MYVEAAMDFPEEEIDFLADSRVAAALVEIENDVAGTMEQASQGALLREGIRLVIAGRPNAGKSSLMNRLTGVDTSIVTTVPGTTRDVVREYIHLDGIPLHLIDTAGIRESSDEVEIEGVKRAMREVEKADQVLIVIDAAAHEDAETSENDWREEAAALMSAVSEPDGATVVLNKRDLVKESLVVNAGELLVSAKTGDGIDELKTAIKRKAGVETSGEGTFIARRRHLEALELAQGHVRSGRSQLEESVAGELLAEELRLAHEALCEITGEFTSDDLLGKIFSSFCIGK